MELKFMKFRSQRSRIFAQCALSLYSVCIYETFMIFSLHVFVLVFIEMLFSSTAG